MLYLLCRLFRKTYAQGGGVQIKISTQVRVPVSQLNKDACTHQGQKSSNHNHHHDHNHSDDSTSQVLHGEGWVDLIHVVHQNVLHLQPFPTHHWSKLVLVREQGEDLHLEEEIGSVQELLYGSIFSGTKRVLSYIFLHVVGHTSQVSSTLPYGLLHVHDNQAGVGVILKNDGF